MKPESEESSLLVLAKAPEASPSPGTRSAVSRRREVLALAAVTVLACSASLALVLHSHHPGFQPRAPVQQQQQQQQQRWRVLLTGFQPFHAFASNPSGLTAAALNGTSLVFPSPDSAATVELHVESLLVDVDRRGVEGVEEHIRAFPGRWDAVVHLGLENAAKGLKLEIAAANILATEDNPPWSTGIFSDDGRGAQSSSSSVQRIVPDAPHLLPTTVRLDYVTLRRLQQETASEHLRRVTELWSRDAGAYYCNELYYRSLETVRRSRDSSWVIPVLFIHLPTPDPDLGLDDMRQAVLEVLLTVAESTLVGRGG
uniref:Pyroglutamyl-peptidase I n=1 Tax=Rhizochromulina marina TaxID=1034831 RepID=A0A7S2VZR4_9STRA|mmetsp:Transcript_10166/g.28999  ORF Transcript_10166/g.28999 Transcript_10166/m.28999 type:complete len:313 (+) Transcript_10166:64-1002(+)